MKKMLYIILSSVIVISCASNKKLKTLHNDQLQAAVAISQDNRMLKQMDLSDTMRVEKDPNEGLSIELQTIRGDRIIMNAVKDEQTGEMIAHDELQAIVVEAKFRNLAERNGEVDIAFDIIVPPAMQDPSWQLRFQPYFFINGDTLSLDQVHITGKDYREQQLRGYQLYNKFLSTIIPDSCNYISTYTRHKLLEVFVERNFKTIAALKNDTSFIDLAYAESLFGVTHQQAVEYYTKHFLVKRNNKRIANKEKMFAKYVKSPLIEQGIRLDSVINNADRTVTYNYVQTIKTRKNLRKVEMVLDGAIYQADQLIYSMPRTEPLTFYISSISAFTDNTPRYIKKIVYRNSVENTAAYIDFHVGKCNIDDTLSNNSEEISRIKGNVSTILENKEYVVDSLIITASCSPEGTYNANVLLADKRAKSIKEYFISYIKHLQDSIKTSVWDIDLTGERTDFSERNIQINTRSIAENWEHLERLLMNDTTLSNKEEIIRCLEIEDADERERALFKTADYRYICSVLYPLLRTVRFDFYLHRAGMIKDTVQTTELDTVYMAGVQALDDRDYKKAVTVLRPYEDYNSAVAYVCMDYNQSALSILEKLPQSARRDYMLAIVHSRLGDEQKAMQYFIHSVEQDYSMRHRANLDPEISQLIKKYAIDDMLDNL